MMSSEIHLELGSHVFQLRYKETNIKEQYTVFSMILQLLVYTHFVQVKYRVVVEYLIPCFYSYLALQSKSNEEINSMLQYW